MATQVDSRRLTGHNMLMHASGAIIDVECSPEERTRIESSWKSHIKRMLQALSWGDESIAIRHTHSGISLAFTAPIDCLYAATEVNEWAWQCALASLSDGKTEAFDDAVARLSAEIQKEAMPALIKLRNVAKAREIPFLSDDDEVSLGYGKYSKTWPIEQIPAPETVPWSSLKAIPTIMVTGTNGKTTTVRLLTSIAKAAGKTPGFSSTDGIWVGGELSESGDYSGPGGARTVLRDKRVDFAILETARGGLLRRGCAIECSDASAVLNVSEDHLGEFGVYDLDDLTQCKMLVSQIVKNDGLVVMNADDPLVMAELKQVKAPVALFSLHADSPAITQWQSEGKVCAFVDDNELVYSQAGDRQVIMKVEELPIAMGGAARHNIANALAATILARANGIHLAAIQDGLSSFKASPANLPGRCNAFQVGGVTIVVDFAHNPHGYAALLDMASRIPANRWSIILGQAGDRDEKSIRDFTRLTQDAKPDRIFIKEMEIYLRGMELGQIPEMIASELKANSYEKFENHPTEIEAVKAAISWAQKGDLVLLPIHAARKEVIELIEQLEKENWQAGEPL